MITSLKPTQNRVCRNDCCNDITGYTHLLHGVGQLNLLPSVGGEITTSLAVN